MNQIEMKQAVAQAAIDYVIPRLNPDSVLGVGTGSTAACFIQLLKPYKHSFAGAVSSSEASAKLLAELGVPLFDLNEVSNLELYVDGADEANPNLQLIKGGGAALTREKIIAACAREFVCIADQTKQVDCLGRFPLPVEVIPMARAYVARELTAMGARPVHRQGVVTDNGNHILDLHDLHIDDPLALETAINQITGVVTNGLFARRPADVLLVGTPDGVETHRAS